MEQGLDNALEFTLYLFVFWEGLSKYDSEVANFGNHLDGLDFVLICEGNREYESGIQIDFFSLENLIINPEHFLFNSLDTHPQILLIGLSIRKFFSQI